MAKRDVELAKSLAEGDKIQLQGRRAQDRYTDEELAALAGLSFTELSLRQQLITKLPPLSATLRTLYLDGCAKLASLDGLERCTSLQELWLHELQLDHADAFAVLAELPELTELWIENNTLREL